MTPATLVPDWRRTAPAGVSLAAAMGQSLTGQLTAAAGTTVGIANSQSPIAKGPVGNRAVDLSQIIRREAQPRWLLPSISLITPQYLEAILRGALLGNHVFQWMLFDLMEDTWPRLVKNLNELKEGAIWNLMNDWRVAPWSVEGEAPTEQAIERARLCKEALFGIPGDVTRNENDFETTLYDVLDAWAKGVSMLEVEWDVREAGAIGQIMAPRSAYWVHPKNYAWDGEGNLKLLVPYTYGAARAGLADGASGQRPRAYEGPWARTDIRMNEAGDGIDIDPDRFIVAVKRSRTGHPLGGALLRPLAWWWCAGNFSADWLLNFAQIFGMPIRWATYLRESPQDTVDKICDALANMGSQAWGAFPEGVKIELKEASKGGEQLPQVSVLDRADKQCDLLILRETLTSHVGREGGNRALGEVHQDTKREVINAAAGFLANVLNGGLVKAVLRLNYGDEQMAPKFEPIDEDPETAKGNAEVIQIAVETGVPVPVDFALEKLNIPKAGEGEAIIQAPSTNIQAPENDQDPNLQGSARGEARRLNAKGSRLNAKGSDEGATDKLVDNVLEDLTGVEARWLGGVRPWMRALVLKAQSDHVTDADFLKALERARREVPELFHRLDAKAVEEALERAMGSALVNGAVRGSVERRVQIAE